MIQIASSDGLAIAEVGAANKALRAELVPSDSNTVSWASYSGMTAQLTGVAVGAPLFALRFIGAGNSRLLVRRFQVAWYTFTFSAIARIDLALSLARGWSVMDTGGNAVAPARHKFEHALPSVEARMAGAAALAAGTRTLDGAIGMSGYYSPANGAALALTSLLAHDAGDHPIVLRQNEGLVLTMPSAPAAAAVTVGTVQCECREVSAWP